MMKTQSYDDDGGFFDDVFSQLPGDVFACVYYYSSNYAQDDGGVDESKDGWILAIYQLLRTLSSLGRTPK